MQQLLKAHRQVWPGRTLLIGKERVNDFHSAE
jgi:hypothetical protein